MAEYPGVTDLTRGVTKADIIAKNYIFVNKKKSKSDTSALQVLGDCLSFEIYSTHGSSDGDATELQYNSPTKALMTTTVRMKENYHFLPYNAIIKYSPDSVMCISQISVEIESLALHWMPDDGATSGFVLFVFILYLFCICLIFVLYFCICIMYLK